MLYWAQSWKNPVRCPKDPVLYDIAKGDRQAKTEKYPWYVSELFLNAQIEGVTRRLSCREVPALKKRFRPE